MAEAAELTPTTIAAFESSTTINRRGVINAAIFLIVDWMSRQQLLEKQKQLKQLHLNNPNYVSRPPIGSFTKSYYPVRESEDVDLNWRPSTKNI